MPPKAKAAITARELLASSDDACVDFMSRTHTKSRRFDISRITDLDSLNPSELEKLSQKLENATKNLNPLDADMLHRLLGSIQTSQQRDTQAEDQAASSRPRQSRDGTRTASPPPSPLTEEDAAHWEALACDKLDRAGGRPALPKTELRPIGEMTEESLQRVVCFVDLPKNAPESYIPPIFTSQLDHWTSFKQRWQWCNRGKAAGKKGFAEFLESMKQKYLAMGEYEWVENTATFEGMARRVWDLGQVGLEASNGKGFKAYARALETRLASHGFNSNSNSSQRFQLLQDPGKQDEWTTLVEYLNFVYWQEDNDRADMEKAEPRYRQAMEELLQLEEEQQPAPLMNSGGTTTPQQQLKAAKEELTKQWERMKFISKDSAPYLRRQALVRRHQLRSRWILEELSLAGKKKKKGPTIERYDIRKNSEIENARETGPTENDVNTRQLRRKRKGRHDDEEEGENADNKTDGVDAPSSLKRSRILGQATIANEQAADTKVAGVPRTRGRGRRTCK